jgi:hypothetical protein
MLLTNSITTYCTTSDSITYLAFDRGQEREEEENTNINPIPFKLKIIITRAAADDITFIIRLKCRDNI